MLDTPLRDWVQLVQRRILSQSTYAGVQTVKAPMDFWVYQEIFFERKPDIVVEIGNWRGGMLLAFAHWCDAVGKGIVYGVDQSHYLIAPAVRQHPRIILITGDAAECAKRIVPEPGAEVLVVEDSAHTFDNTLAVLRAYSSLVAPGGYFTVEDTICRHGLETGPSPGPYEAVQAFLAESPEWAADRSREAFGVTWNPHGFLRRKG